PVIDLRRDEMHRTSMDALASFESPPMRVQSLEGGQEGRVDVYHPALPFLNHGGGKQAHISGEGDNLGTQARQRVVYGLIMSLAASKILAANDLHRQVWCNRNTEPRRIGLIGDHA